MVDGDGAVVGSAGSPSQLHCPARSSVGMAYPTRGRTSRAPSMSPHAVTRTDATCASPSRCRQVPIALQMPSNATPPVATVNPTTGSPHRAGHGQYIRLPAAATAAITFTQLRHAPP